MNTAHRTMDLGVGPRDAQIDRVAQAAEECGRSGQFLIVKLPDGRRVIVAEAPSVEDELTAKAESIRALQDELFVESLERAVWQTADPNAGTAMPMGTRPGDERIAAADPELLQSIERGLQDLTRGAAGGSAHPKGWRP